MLKEGTCRSLFAALAVAAATWPGAARAARFDLPPGPAWQVLSSFSSGENYYTVLEESGTRFLRADFRPPARTTILYAALPSPRRCHTVSWKWRVHKFPKGADETIEGRMDNAAAVYVYFETTLKKYVIKYVWSVAHPTGFNFRTKDSGMLQKMQVVVKRGPAPETSVWAAESVDPIEDFRRYFLNGNQEEEVPPIRGVGILSDGDGTKTEVMADYTGFVASD